MPEELEDYCKESSVFSNLMFDKVLPVHPSVDLQYRCQKVLRGTVAYECVFIAECVRRAMLHPRVQKRFTVAFIGCGAIGTGILDGLLQVGHPPDSIIVSTRRPEIFGKYRKMGMACVEDNAFALKKARVVFLACLPSQLKAAISKLRGQLKKTTIVVSILAGTCITTIKNMLGAAPEQFMRVQFDAESLQENVHNLKQEHLQRAWELRRAFSPRAGEESEGRGEENEGDFIMGSDISLFGTEHQFSQSIDMSTTNLCADLALRKLTEPNLRIFSIVRVVQFLLRRLGCGTVATRVAVESVLGARKDTDLRLQIKHVTEELQYQEEMYQNHEPIKRKDRISAQKAIKHQKALIKQLTLEAAQELNGYLSACMRCYALHVPAAQHLVEKQEAEAQMRLTEQQAQPDKQPDNISQPTASTAVNSPPLKAGAVGDDETHLNVSCSPLQDAGSMVLSDFVRNSFEKAFEKYVPVRMVTYLGALPSDNVLDSGDTRPSPLESDGIHST